MSKLITSSVSWFISIQESRLRQKLLKEKNFHSLCSLVVFSVKHRRAFPMENPEIRTILFGSSFWKIDSPYQGFLLEEIETYLFHNIETSKNLEWQAWFRALRLLNCVINVKATETADALLKAFKAHKLDGLLVRDREYLVNCYWSIYKDHLEGMGAKKYQEILPILLEFGAKQQLDLQEVSKWFKSGYLQILEARFIASKDNRALKDLMIFTVDHHLSFPIEKSEIREGVFGVSSWEMESKYQETLFSEVEKCLFENVDRSKASEWRTWLRASQDFNRPINVTNTRVTTALLKAYDTGKLNQLPIEDRNYLFNCYWDAYQVLLEANGIKKYIEIFPILLELPSKQQVPNAKEFSNWLKSSFCILVLEERFKDRQDQRSLTELTVFTVDYHPPFPIHKEEIRDVLFNIPTWEMEDKYQEHLFSYVETYLFNNVDKSKPQEWQAWFKNSKFLGRPIKVKDTRTANALAIMRSKFALTLVLSNEYRFLIECYQNSFSSTITIIKDQDQEQVAKLLIEHGPIDKVGQIPNWILSKYKTVLEDRFKKEKDNPTLIDLVSFSADHSSPFPIHKSEMREALVNTPSWQMEEEYKEHLFAYVEAYLFRNVETSKNREWQAWLRASRLLSRSINISNSQTRAAMLKAYRLKKLEGLSDPEGSHLFDCYWHAYKDQVEREGIKKHQEILPILLEFEINQQLDPQEFSKWIRSAYLQILETFLTNRKDNHSLKDLISFTVDYCPPFSLHKQEIKDAVFDTPSWEMKEKYQNILFETIENYLFGNIEAGKAEEWRTWLKQSRLLHRPIDISNSKTTQVFLEAYNAGKLNKLSEIDCVYLLDYYWEAHQVALTERGIKKFWEVFPILLEIDSKQQQLEANTFSDWLKASYYKIVLRARLIGRPDQQSLRDLISFGIDHDLPFPIEDSKVREVVVALNFWELEDSYRKKLINYIEGYLFQNIGTSTKKEWEVWLKACNLSEHPINVMNKETAQALNAVRNRFKRTPFSDNEYTFLKRCYENSFGSTLAKIKRQDQDEIILLLIEHGPIDQVEKISYWLLSKYKTILETRLIKKQDNPSIKDLVAFSIDHCPPFPIDKPEIRGALFKVPSWRMEEKYQQALFLDAETYLFSDIEAIQREEWQAWLKACRELNHSIDVKNEKTTRAIFRAYKAGKLLQELPHKDYIYLLNSYFDVYKELLEKNGVKKHHEILPLLLELPLKQQKLETDELSKWLKSSYCESVLQVRVKQSTNQQSLTELITFVVEHNLPFPIDDVKIRKVVFSLNFWKIEEPYREALYSYIEDYLSRSLNTSSTEEWHIWLKTSHLLGRPINVMRNEFAHALRYASEAGKFKDLPKEDYQYLAEQFQREFRDILEDTRIEKGVVTLPHFLRFASVAQFLGLDIEAKKILGDWARSLRIRPRALAEMSDAEAFRAPLRGIGSPNGTSITIYRNIKTGHRTRITCAGITGDATLNDQIFTGLFAYALNCDIKDTFITTGGAVLFLEPQHSNQGPITQNLHQEENDKNQNDKKDELMAVIGIDGPKSPQKPFPRVGQDHQTALDSLVTWLFEQAHRMSGLVKYTPAPYHFEDYDELEEQIKGYLESKGSQRFIKIPNQNQQIEPASIIYIMPLYHRNQDGKAVPIEIEMSYDFLGAEQLYILLHDLRHTYMLSLIRAARIREELAKEQARKQAEAIYHWNNIMNEEGRERLCEASPFVSIGYEIDFERGFVIELDQPRQMNRREYEERVRPSLKKTADEFEIKFKELGERLTELNGEGGKADVLTFRLLIDSLIRQAPLSISHPKFQTEYKRWVETSSAPVWTAIETWARDREIPPERLAADNILFKATPIEANPKGGQDRVLIQPWVMIDMQDFTVIVDREKGLMDVYSNGKTPSLEDVLLPDAQKGISDLTSLHQQFVQWAAESLELNQPLKHHEEKVGSEIFANPKIARAIQYRKAKSLLYRRYRPQPQQAAAMLEEFCKQRFTPAYFWSAICKQSQSSLENQLPGILGIHLNILQAVDYLRYSLNREKDLQKHFKYCIASERESRFSEFFQPESMIFTFLFQTSRDDESTKPIVDRPWRFPVHEPHFTHFPEILLHQEILSYPNVRGKLARLNSLTSLEEIVRFLLTSPLLNLDEFVTKPEILLELLLMVPKTQASFSGLIPQSEIRSFKSREEISEFLLSHPGSREYLTILATSPEKLLQLLLADTTIKAQLSRLNLLNKLHSLNPQKDVIQVLLLIPALMTSRIEEQLNNLIRCDTPNDLLEILLRHSVVKEKFDQLVASISPEHLLEELFGGLIDPTVIDLLKRLISLDKEFAQSIVEQQPDSILEFMYQAKRESRDDFVNELFDFSFALLNFISEKESEALELTSEDEKYLQTYVNPFISAIEFINLGYEMKRMAADPHALPFTLSKKTDDKTKVQAKVREMIEQFHSLPFRELDLDTIEQIENLEQLMPR